MSFLKPLLNHSRAGVWLDELRRAVRRAYICDSPDIRVVRSEHGASLLINDRGAAGSKIQQYLLTDATHGDYFVCRTLGVRTDNTDPEHPVQVPSVGRTDVYIAKPFNLRRTPFDGETIEIEVESWDGATLSSTTRTLGFDYKSATFRIATDQTDPDEDNWFSENQIIIPRFVPATLDEPEDTSAPVTITNTAPTIIYAITCSGLNITTGAATNPPDQSVTLLALNDGQAWARNL